MTSTIFPASALPDPSATGPVPELTFEDGERLLRVPDYGALFSVCEDHRLDPDDVEGCPACDASVLSPRMAFMLVEGLADLEANLGSEFLEAPVRSDGSVDLSACPSRGLLPPVAQVERSRGWMVRFIQCFSDLRSRLESGLLPSPQCTGEEMALHLGIGVAERLEGAGVLNRWYGNWERSFPAVHAYDLDFGWVRDILFEDHDVLMLFNPASAGIAAPGNLIGEYLGVAHLSPDEWFIPFRGADLGD